MLLDEIKLMAQKKYEDIKDDPNVIEADKKLAANSIKLFNNEDALLGSAKSTILGILYFIGYEHKDVRKIYDDLMQEINKKYTLVHPDMVQDDGVKHKWSEVE